MPFEDEVTAQTPAHGAAAASESWVNNSIADSNAMILPTCAAGCSDLMQECRKHRFTVARYGNFVTYDPPLTPPISAAVGVAAGHHRAGGDNRRPHAPAVRVFPDRIVLLTPFRGRRHAQVSVSSGVMARTPSVTTDRQLSAGEWPRQQQRRRRRTLARWTRAQPLNE